MRFDDAVLSECMVNTGLHLQLLALNGKLAWSDDAVFVSSRSALLLVFTQFSLEVGEQFWTGTSNQNILH